MKKKLFTVSNLLLTTFITLLGFGACKTHKHSEIEALYGPPPGYEEEMMRQAEEERIRQAEAELRQKQIEDSLAKIKEMEKYKTVYGPPAVERLPE